MLVFALSACQSEQKTGRWFTQAGDSDVAFSEIHFVNEQQGWAVGWDGQKAKEADGWIVQATRDGGITWEQMPGQVQSNIRFVYFVTPAEGWAITTAHHILHTSDGGATWKTQREAGTVDARNEAYPNPMSKQPEPIDHLFFVNPTTGWAWGGGQRRPGFYLPGVLLRTSDGGRAWTTLGYPFENELVAVQFVDAERGWACEYKGNCYRSDDGGRSWSRLTIREGTAVNALHFIDRENGWVVTGNGIGYRTSDGGATWQFRRTGAREDLRGVFFLTPRHGWVVGNGGAVLFTKNGGDDWTRMDAGVQTDLTRIQFAGPHHAWAAGNGGTILHYVE
jgi:photosystem II stability/assembly factor-like uncharacterized protein